MGIGRTRGLALGASVGAVLTALPATGLAAEAAHEVTEVSEVTVTATRTETPVDEAPATVTVITAQEIEDTLAADIKDLVRFEPNVSVRTQPARFGAALGSTGRDGNSGFNIRGLEGNRVLIQVDGVRVPDAFAFGAQSVGRGDYADLEILKSVEILRGPASALYGSDGVAGAVSFVTRDPSDLLDPGQDFTARVRAAYASADESWSESVAVAGRSGAWSGLLSYTRRDGQETETQGDVTFPDSRRTAANPQDIESNSVLGKLVFMPNDEHRFRLTVDHYDREVVTEVLSGRAAGPLAAASVIDLDARDTTDRDRIAFDHRYTGAGGFIDEAQWTLYWQQSETREFTDEDRNTAADRIRDNTFDTQVWGFSGQAVSSFTAFDVPHRVVWGADASVTRQEGLRDGTVPPTGETFPARAFPNTDYTLVGLFVQDEISFLDGRLKLYPALRYDWYELEPEVDALYPGLAIRSSDERLSPKLGAVYWSDSGWGLFANYADGFRAPSPMQVNNSFSNPIFGYISIPNPNLEPETSRTFEAGVRFRDLDLAGGTWQGQAAAFTGEYENFIEQVALTGPLPSLCGGFPLCYQYVNLGAVEISGFEARLDGRWDNGFGMTAALGLAEGDARSAGAEFPLDSVDPLKVVVGVSYRQPAGRWGAQAIATYSDRKNLEDVGGLCAPGNDTLSCYRPDEFTLLDVTAWWRVTGRATIRAGAFNLTDETYAWWSDVRGLSATSTVLNAYTQPGRNVSVSLTYKF